MLTPAPAAGSLMDGEAEAGAGGAEATEQHGPQPRPRAVRRAAVLLAAGLALLSLAWVVATPPWAAPDEPAGFSKGVSTARGHPLGQVPDYQPTNPSFVVGYWESLTRTADVPNRLQPLEPIPCYAFTGDDASCLDRAPSSPYSLTPEQLAALDAAPGGTVSDIRLLVAKLSVEGPPDEPRPVRTTYIGTYQPWAYAVPALVALPAGSPDAGLYLARLAHWAIALSMIGIGLWALSQRGRWALAGGAVALTPMVLFLAATLTSSGFETTAAFAHVACLLALRRGDAVPRGLWRGLAASAVVLALSRTLGPAWLVAADGVAVAVLGRPWVRRQWAAQRRWVLTYAGLTAGACAATAVWQIAVQPRPPQSYGRWAGWLDDAWGTLGAQYHQQIGVFGWLDTPIPHWTVWVWTAAVAVLAVGAWRRQGRRAVAVLAALVAATVVAALGLAVAFSYPVGSGAQGRWVLPVAMTVPLVAGALAGGSARTSRLARRGPAVALGATVVVQVVALWTAARRYAVGASGPWWFNGRSRWAPPGGWAPSLALMALGAMMMVAAAWTLAADGGEER